MRISSPNNLVYLPDFLDKIKVFRNREHAGKVLTGMLEAYRHSDAIVVAIPAGGVPVAKALATRLDLPLDIAVVNKITLPWNTEAGYGAIAFDGTVRLNDRLVRQIGLSKEEIRQGIKKTSDKVERRSESYGVPEHYQIFPTDPCS
jgi:predicted phosphoribosyltransferase